MKLEPDRLHGAFFNPNEAGSSKEKPASLSEEIPNSYAAADAFLFSCVAGDADVHPPGRCFCGLHAEAEFSEEARTLNAGGAEARPTTHTIFVPGVSHLSEWLFYTDSIPSLESKVHLVLHQYSILSFP